MKKVKKHIRLFLAAIVAMITLHGCELAGLELQQPFEYDYNVGMKSNALNKTPWEFIQSRPDLFSHLIKGIQYAGLEDLYNQPLSTYLLVTNSAFNRADSKDTVAFFYKNQVPDPLNPLVKMMPDSLNDYSVEFVRDFLKYHIIKGAFTFTNVPTVSDWYDTYVENDTAKINMFLARNRNTTIIFRGNSGQYSTTLNSIVYDGVYARTSNLLASNGSYIHVLSNWIKKPFRYELED